VSNVFEDFDIFYYVMKLKPLTFVLFSTTICNSLFSPIANGCQDNLWPYRLP